MTRDIAESHAARRREGVGRMVRTLFPPPTTAPARSKPAPRISPEVAGALARQSVAMADAAALLPPPTKAPPIDPRMAAFEESMTEVPLGEMTVVGDRRGRAWVAAPARLGHLVGFEFEMLPDQAIGPNDTTVPSPGVWVVGTSGEYIPTRRWPAGTFAHGAAPKGPRKIKPGRLFDALAAVPFLGGTRDRLTPVGVTAGTPPTRGEAILRAYTAKGYGLRCAGEHLLVELPGGHDPNGILGLLAIPGARDLLHGWAAHLAGIGEPRSCEHPDHAGDPAPAVTVAVADVLVCDACMA